MVLANWMRTHKQHQDKDCASWQFVVGGSTINTVHSDVAEQHKTAPLQHHYSKCNSQFWRETMKMVLAVRLMSFGMHHSQRM